MRRSLQFPGISWNLGSDRDVKKKYLKECVALGGMHRERDNWGSA